MAFTKGRPDLEKSLWVVRGLWQGTFELGMDEFFWLCYSMRHGAFKARNQLRPWPVKGPVGNLASQSRCLNWRYCFLIYYIVFASIMFILIDVGRKGIDWNVELKQDSRKTDECDSQYLNEIIVVVIHNSRYKRRHLPLFLVNYAFVVIIFELSDILVRHHHAK